MKTKSVIIVAVILCVSILTVALAGMDVPLKSKIPSWKYVIIIQAGKPVVFKNASGSGKDIWSIERNVVEVLRGDKNKLPTFYMYSTPTNQIQGKYYLMCYFDPVVYPCVPFWTSYDLQTTNNSFIVKNCWAKEIGLFDGRMADYYDMPLEKFKKLLNQIPYEADKDKRKILTDKYKMTNPEP